MKLKPLDSHELYQWPEFHAFMARLGVRTDLPILNLRVEVDYKEGVLVGCQYRGVDASQSEGLQG